MRKLFFVGCLFALMIGIIMGCQGSDKEETASSNPGEVMQYRGVCTYTEAHEGHEYVLTKWLDSKDKVLVYTKEHERKNKSHTVRIEERVKPAKNQP